MAFQKATKVQAKLRLALCGLAGSGKTFSGLAIGTNLVPGGRVALIDTERESASLYADKFEFDTCALDTHSPLAYVEKIREAEDAGYDVIVIDSLSHAWAGRDGALDQKDKAADRGGNSWTAWRDITPKHNALVDAIISCKAHVIATMRTKMEYVQEKNEKTGKVEIKKVGLAAIQREGMEYEFTVVGDIDLNNTLRISKTRLDGVLSPGDMFEKPGASLAKKMYAWLMSGAAPAARPVATPAPAPDSTVATALADGLAAYLAAMQAAPDHATLERVATGPGKPVKGTPEHARATAVYLERSAVLAQAAA